MILSMDALVSLSDSPVNVPFELDLSIASPRLLKCLLLATFDFDRSEIMMDCFGPKDILVERFLDLLGTGPL